MEKSREGVALKGNTSVPTSNFVVESAESWDDSSKSINNPVPQSQHKQINIVSGRSLGGVCVHIKGKLV